MSVDYASERILKIDQYLAMTWTKVWWHVFMDHGVFPTNDQKTKSIYEA